MKLSRSWLMLPLLLLLLGQIDPLANPTPPATSPAAPTPSAALQMPPGLQVAVIPVEGEIYGFTMQSLQRRVTRALASGATAIALEIDSPGGTLVSSLEISRYIKSLGVPTVAWVHNSAYSGAAVLATACQQIVMSPASVIGDCAPIVPGMTLEATERAKALSPLLSELRDSARRNGYDYALLHAMCVLGVEVYLVENPASGERRAVNAADYAVMVRGQDAETADRGQRGWFAFGQSTTDPGRASVDVATEADRGRWKLVRKVHDGQTLLTLSQTQAVEVRLARNDQIAQTADLQRFLGAAGEFRVPQTWSEATANWLTSPVVRGILVMALLLGAYIELQSPGLGLPGGVALLALVALVGAPFMVGLAEIWHIILIGVGLLLLAVELLLIPGFGFVGITGVVLMLAGLVLAVVPSSGGGPLPLPDPAMAGVLRDSMLWTLAGLVLAAIGLFWLTRYFGRIPVLNRLVLTTGQSAPAATRHVSGGEALGEGRIAVGEVGHAVGHLRPTGRARFGDLLVDVVSLGEWIEPDRRVRVVEVAGNRIVVEAE